MVPMFGRGTIQKFSNNVSEMKKLAARNFEDILQVGTSPVHQSLVLLTNFQCSIPVFDRLLPEPFNSIILTLLYQTVKWHALAKLRIHSESTLCHLESQTKVLGQQMRAFRDVTKDKLNTVELPGEAAARRR